MIRTDQIQSTSDIPFWTQNKQLSQPNTKTRKQTINIFRAYRLLVEYEILWCYVSVATTTINNTRPEITTKPHNEQIPHAHTNTTTYLTTVCCCCSHLKTLRKSFSLLSDEHFTHFRYFSFLSVPNWRLCSCLLLSLMVSKRNIYSPKQKQDETKNRSKCKLQVKETIVTRDHVGMTNMFNKQKQPSKMGDWNLQNTHNFLPTSQGLMQSSGWKTQNHTTKAT